MFWKLLCFACLINLSIERKILKDSLCSKDYFYRKFVNQEKTLKEDDYDRLKKCSLEEKKCTGYPGTLTVTYAEDQFQRLLVVISATDMSKQGCWGYSLQIKDDLSSVTHYFNMDGKVENYNKYYFIKLGFHYEFTVIPLPSGKPMVIKTKAPSLCEMEVIEIVRKRLESKEIFKTCDSPGYEARQSIAQKICKLYPDDILQRITTAKENLIEKDCKFVLQSYNIV